MRVGLTGSHALHYSADKLDAVLGLGKVLYDPAHQPFTPEGWFFRSLLAFAALMRSIGAVLAMQTSSILLGLPLGVVQHWIPMPRLLGQRLLQALPEAVMALLISWLLLRYAHKAPLSELGLGWRPGAWKETLLGALGGVVALALAVLPLLAFGFGEFETSESKIRGPVGLAVLLGLFALAAFSEELILRGYAFQTLAYPLHMIGAVILTSGVFAALHLNNRGTNEFTVANTFLAGCVLGMLLAWRRSLWPVAAAHFGWNLATIALGLNVSGIVIPLVPFRIAWRLDPIWTGGSYGPEGGLPCTIVLSLLLLILIRLYYHRQSSGQTST